MTAVDVRDAPFAELPASRLYAILRLRAEVFVVEQACAYLDPDGVDDRDGTRHLWVEEAGRVVACARVAGHTIGRVATAADRRHHGIGTAVLRRAVELAEPPASLNAQSRLAGWYARFGFVVSGPEFVEDGIPHVPMTTAGAA